MTANHLTPAELDALLEAATALDEHWELHHGEHSLRVCNGQHDALGGCQALVEAEILGHSRWSSESRAKFVSVANPATITHLVLMVRELQERLRVKPEIEAVALSGIKEGIRQREQNAVEHFRVRAVRAIQQLYEVPTPHNIDISLGYAEGLEGATKLIESLPLVETEDDNAV